MNNLIKALINKLLVGKTDYKCVEVAETTIIFKGKETLYIDRKSAGAITTGQHLTQEEADIINLMEEILS